MAVDGKHVLEALSTPYGQFFAIKLGVFLGIIGFAACNKLRLTPALLLQEPRASAHLRRSIQMELVLVALILMTADKFLPRSARPKRQTKSVVRPPAVRPQK